MQLWDCGDWTVTCRNGFDHIVGLLWCPHNWCSKYGNNNCISYKVLVKVLVAFSILVIRESIRCTSLNLLEQCDLLLKVSGGLDEMLIHFFEEVDVRFSLYGILAFFWHSRLQRSRAFACLQPQLIEV